ncbi:uncharacterized protein HKW66_Vig0244670 [Vigna angularis]|uniref:Uncharacterized protein n=1 Tax=Phaseolus angularis TaxID=3914 RepID=A0A8T0KWV1_PHAAN|nr:uncharacterized protein HKW66_Vig0244670 [Vigna angularis]
MITKLWRVMHSWWPLLLCKAVANGFHPTTLTRIPDPSRTSNTVCRTLSGMCQLRFLSFSSTIMNSYNPIMSIEVLKNMLKLNYKRFVSELQVVGVRVLWFTILISCDVEVFTILGFADFQGAHDGFANQWWNEGEVVMEAAVWLNIHCGWDNSVVSLRSDDEDADEWVRSVVNQYGGGHAYSVVVVNEGGEVRSVVGKYRHAWIVGRVEEEEAVLRVAEIFVKVFVNGGDEEGLVRSEFMPVGADGRIVLSFSLLNADPRDWIYDWNFREIDKTLLQPVIEALQPIANISVESQVLYHTPKSSFSYWDDKHGSHIFTAKDLPFFVNSNEWHLDTSVAAGGRSKVLQLVVYIPSAKECPLQLKLPNGDISKTNGFISPMWGGVVVWNPQSCIKDLESNDPVRNTISHQDLQMLFEVLMGQLRQLLGLKSDNLYVGESGTSILLGSERGFTEWELDVLSRKHICFNLLSCTTTLGSLSRLVQSLPRMIIMDEIGKQVIFWSTCLTIASWNIN